MEEKRLVPKRRFKDYLENWKLKKISDVGEIIGGGTPNTAIKEYWNGSINWFSPTEIGDKPYVFESQKKITELGLQYSSAKVLPAQKTVLFTSRAGIGDMAILAKDAATNQGFQSIVVKEDSDVYFIYSMGFKIKEYALKNASGSTFLEISGKELSKAPVVVPEVKEQEKIGQFFKVLDKRIVNQEKKIAKVKALKEAYLSEMFPQEGETVPKRRFRGFNDNWIEKSIGDMYRVSTGYPFSSKDFKLKGLYKVITNKNIQDQDRKMEKNYSYVNNLGNLIIESYRLIGQNVLVSMDGEVGITGRFSDEKALLAQRVARIEGDNLEFLYQFTKRKQFIRDMDNISVGNIIKHISLNQIRDYIIKVPKQIEEQEKIAAFFKNLDDQIEAEEAKLEKLKKMKKAYLEEMFV